MPPALIWTLPFVHALLFWASFHPVNAGVLAYVSLVPLLIFARATTGKKSFFVAWAGGWLAYVLGYSWMGYTVPVGPYFVAVYKGFYIAVFVLLVRRIGVNWSPVLWVGLEQLGGILFGGLPWLQIGYTQHEAFHLIQILDLGGIALVSLLVAAVNAVIVNGSLSARAAMLGVIMFACAYGSWRVKSIELFDGPKIAVVQPNIPQDLKTDSLKSPKQALDNYKKHVDLSILAAEQKPDLIVWPEAAIYRGVIRRLDGEEPGWLKTTWYQRLLEPAERLEIPTLIGSLIVELKEGDQDAYTNSALLVTPEQGVVARYDKVHLVPFAETFSFFKELVRRYSGLKLENMKPGTEFPVWDLGPWRYGVQICYEAIFPEISREIARKGAAFSVNISNDGWFKTSGELDQMLAMARYRSIENRMHVIRATNTGISAFIAPTGEVQQVLEVGGKRKEVEGILVGRIKLAKAWSLSRTLGDWVAWLMLAGTAALIAGRIFVDTRKKSA